MTTTLFAIRLDSDSPDDMIEVLDHVADAGVDDKEWEWLTWVTPRGRTYCVVRGSMRARGAFVDAPGVTHVLLSSALHQSQDSRCRWIEPKDASGGRERLEQWVAFVEAAAPAVPVVPRARTEQAVVSAGTVRVRRPDVAPPAPRVADQGHAPSGRGGAETDGRTSAHRPSRAAGSTPVRTATTRQVNPVLSAFGFGTTDDADKASLYAPPSRD